MRDERWETRRRVVESVVWDDEGGDAEQAWGDEWGDAFKVDKGNRARLERAGRVVKHEVEGRVLVGAEAHRARLERLLERRRGLESLGGGHAPAPGAPAAVRA